MTLVHACKFCGTDEHRLVPARVPQQWRCADLDACAERMIRARVKAGYRPAKASRRGRA